MNLNLGDFQPIIKAMVRNASTNGVFSKEDLEQELMCKLINTLPKFEVTTKHEIFKMAKVILKNHLTDIVRSQARKSDTSVYAKKDNLEEIIQEAAIDIDLYMVKFPDPYQSYRDNEMKSIVTNVIGNWMKDKDQKTRDFINGVLEGNKPYSLIDKIGITSYRVRDILGELKKYLVAYGYSI